MTSTSRNSGEIRNFIKNVQDFIYMYKKKLADISCIIFYMHNVIFLTKDVQLATLDYMWLRHWAERSSINFIAHLKDDQQCTSPRSTRFLNTSQGDSHLSNFEKTYYLKSRIIEN